MNLLNRLKLYFYRNNRDFRLDSKYLKVPGPLLFLEQEDDNHGLVSPEITEARLDGLGSGDCHSRLFEAVTDPEQADYIVFPYDLADYHSEAHHWGMVDFICNLPHFGRFPHKHVFDDRIDWAKPLPLSGIYFKGSVDKRNKTGNTIAKPYFVEDFANYLHYDFSRIPFHLSFVGGLTDPLREKIAHALKDDQVLRKYFVFRGGFYGCLENFEHNPEHRREFIDSMRNSLTVLCPRGWGRNSYRFFETLSMGRIPILIADHCELPLEDRIDYDFVVRVEEEAIRDIPAIFRDRLFPLPRDAWMEKCRRARSFWESVCTKSAWRRIMLEILWERKTGTEPLLLNSFKDSPDRNAEAEGKSANGAKEAPALDIQPGAEGYKRLKLFFYRPGRDFYWKDGDCELPLPLLFHQDEDTDFGRVKPETTCARLENMADSGYYRRFFLPVDDPGQADYFIFPFDLADYHMLNNDRGMDDFIRHLPHYPGNEDRHVFDDRIDWITPPGVPGIYFRASVDKRLHPANVHVRPFFVENYERYLHFEPDRLKYLYSFIGAQTGNVRARVGEALKDAGNHARYCVFSSEFFDNLEDMEHKKDKREIYRQVLRDSLLVLCPAGWGKNSLRFFECMSMGRIPLLISDCCALPLENEIDYSFAVQVFERSIPDLPLYMDSFRVQFDLEKCIRKCRLARNVWENYFTKSKWREAMLRILTATAI